MGADEKTSELVAFACAPTWEADHPAAWLEDFTGHLQGDRYAGHAAMLHDHSKEPIVPRSAWLGRGMHVRARVEKAAKSNDARAVVALAYFKAIYRIEASWKAEGLSSEARRVRREVQSIPQVDELYRWTHQLHPRLVPNTPLFEATRDAINQEAARRQKGPSGIALDAAHPHEHHQRRALTPTSSIQASVRLPLQGKTTKRQDDTPRRTATNKIVTAERANERIPP